MIELVDTSILVLAWLLIQQYMYFILLLLFAWNIKFFLAYKSNYGESEVIIILLYYILHI